MMQPVYVLCCVRGQRVKCHRRATHVDPDGLAFCCRHERTVNGVDACAGVNIFDPYADHLRERPA